MTDDRRRRNDPVDGERRAPARAPAAKLPVHRDYAGVGTIGEDEKTSPGVHANAPHPAIDPDNTPVAELFAQVVGMMEDRISLTKREREVQTAYLASMMNVILQHDAHAKARDPGFALRIVQIEEWRRREVDPFRFRVTGYDGTNGLIGKLTERVDDLRKDVGDPDACAAVHAVIKRQRWMGAKIMGALLAASTIAGGGIYTVRDSYDAEVEARGVTKQWRRGVEEDFRRLFAAFGWDRPASASPPQPPPTTGTP